MRSVILFPPLLSGPCYLREKALTIFHFSLNSHAHQSSIIRITKKGEHHETTASDPCADLQPNVIGR